MGQEVIMELIMELTMELITLNITALPMQFITPLPITLNILALCPRELLSGPSLIM